MLTAHQVMAENVICIPWNTAVEDAARLLLDNRISGAPVTDAGGRLIGIVSEYNLLAMVYDPPLRSLPVTQFMTKEIVSVNADTTLEDVANLFIVNRIRRVPVLDDGKVVGIVSRPELLRYVLESRYVLASHGCSDANEIAAAMQPSAERSH